MKKIISIAAAVLVLAGISSCKKAAKDEPLSIVGEWQLASVATKSANVNGTVVDIYIQFDETSFNLYQKIGEGRYVHHEGTYLLTGNVLTGTYTDGADLASSYIVSREGETLVLTSQTQTQEEQTYKSVTIPDSVKDDAI